MKKLAGLTNAERQPYKDMAIAEQARDACEEAEEQEEDDHEHAEGDLPFTSAWSIGNASSPLSSQHICDPPFSPDLSADLERWLAQVEAIVQHKGDALPSRVTVYDNSCEPGLCMNDELFRDAMAMKTVFLKSQKSQVLSAYTVIGESAANKFCINIMVAHKFDRPVKMVFIRVQPARPTTL